MKQFVLIFLLSACICVHAQRTFVSQNIDSLKTALKTKKTSNAKVNAFVDLVRSFDQYDSMIIYGKRALQFADAEQNKFGLAYIYSMQSELAVEHGNYDDALQFGEKALEACAKAQNDSLMAKTYHTIGFTHYTLSNFDKAAENYYKGLKYSEKHNYMHIMAHTYNHLGLTHMTKRPVDKEKALMYYFKAEELNKKINNARDLGFVWLRLGSLYSNSQEFDKGDAYLAKALRLADSCKLFDVKKWTIEAMAGNLKRQKKYEQAIPLYIEALALSKQLKEPPGIVISQVSLASAYSRIGDTKNAMLHADSALENCYKYKIHSSISSVYKCKSVIYEKKGDLASAFAWYKKASNTYDSLFRTENSANLNELEKKYQTEKKEKELAEKSSELLVQKADKEKHETQRNIFIVGMLLFLGFSVFIFRGYRQKQKDNQVISNQKKIVEEKQKEIIDSISYAKRLQDAILPPHEFLDKKLKDNFIYYQPKDIVAGDFYWAEEIDGKFFIAAADSTGHGVPGAIVSVVCSNALNRSVKEFHLTDTGKILDKTRELVLETFEKSSENVKDGMDISLLCLDLKTKAVTWSGANNPIWYIENNEFKEIKANKQPIGKTEKPAPFTTHAIDAKKDSTFYLFTDGLADQFGGPQGKKFKYKQFSELLVANQHLSMKEQMKMIHKTFDSWKGGLEQVDDVCVIGIKV